MILAEIVEGKKEALRVAEVARILDVSIKKIYRMAAKGQIPTLKISNSIRFDLHDIAAWLRRQSSTNPIPAEHVVATRRLRPCRPRYGRAISIALQEGLEPGLQEYADESSISAWLGCL